MPMNRLPSPVPPTKESRDQANDALIPVRMRVRDGQAIGLVDMDGNDLGLPVTTQRSAQGVANAPALTSRGALPRRTRRLTKNIISRVKTYTPATDWTCCFTVELETDAISFRIGLPNVHTSQVTGVKVSIAVSDAVVANTASRYTPSTGVHIPVTFGGAATATLPARIAAERPSMTYSDEIQVNTIPRLDGGGRPWVMVRMEFPSGTVMTVPYNSFVYWHTIGLLDRFAYSTGAAVLGVTTPASFAGTGQLDNVVIPAIAYTSKAPGRQVLCNGDSTVEGVGAQPTNGCATLYAALAVSTPTDPVEVFISALHGQAPLTYVERVPDVITTVAPTHVVYSPYSINGVSAGGMTAAEKSNYYAALTRFLGVVDNLPCQVLLLEGLPCNAAYKNIGANDSIRRDLNAELPGFVGAQLSATTSYASAMSGPLDGNGQTTIAAGLAGDNVHPNSLGYAAIQRPIQTWLSIF